MTEHDYPFVSLRPGARWPKGQDGKRLVHLLNRAGRRAGRLIVVTSGDRNPREAWAAYQDYLRGGTLAAKCCSKGWPHTWAECGKRPQSNHARGRAADCIAQTHRRGGEFVNIGEVPEMRVAMKDVGLCLPVGSGETWHVEVGNTWRS